MVLEKFCWTVAHLTAAARFRLPGLDRDCPCHLLTMQRTADDGLIGRIGWSGLLIGLSLLLFFQ